ncbi:MAG: ASKHA domain-containing protein, partial [Dehalococcoidia bacterium]|nr:ASKHA domain-containing protein [Dehalococcoidia bacterium]
MSQQVNTFEVKFLPSGKRVAVPEDSLLLEAANEAGISLDTPCGGQGRCGRCRVKVDSGKVSQQESHRLTKQQIAEGWVLACSTRVVDDVVILEPTKKEREQVVVETADTLTETPLTCGFTFAPPLQRIHLDVPAPSLEDAANDVDRVKRALASQHGIEHARLELPVIQKLAAALRQKNWEVTVTIFDDKSGGPAEVINIYPGKKKGPVLGLAVDIGTTNVVIDLVDLATGRILDRASERNKQIIRGEDVISRIYYSEKGKGLLELQNLVIETINLLINDLAKKHKFSPDEVEDMVVAGNTIMLHFFLGLRAKSLREEPYVPTLIDFPLLKAGQLGVKINRNAYMYCIPAVAAYVGGDIVAGVLSSCLYQSEKLTLFLDIGTNGEIVLGNADWLVSCACSAGPAFEGGGVQCGMRATIGAIEDIRIDSNTLEPTISVIGDTRPLGICGSGMIAALAEMLVTGIVDRGGRIHLNHSACRPGICRLREGEHGDEYVLVWASDSGTGQDIVINEVDINNLIRTKAAIYAGITVMLRSLNIDLESLEQVLIGGAFGQHINIEEAIQIGLLPDLPWERFKFLGNTSAQGSYHALLSREARSTADEIARRLTYLELIAENTFMDEFTSALFLPHTNLDALPSVKTLLIREGGGYDRYWRV